MAKRYFIRTKFLEPGMQIDQAVNNRLDQLLVQSGTILDKSDITSIERLGIPGVYILDEGAVAQPRNKQAVTHHTGKKKYRTIQGGRSPESDPFQHGKGTGFPGYPVFVQQYGVQRICRDFCQHYQ